MKKLPLIVLVTLFAIAASNAENRSSNTKQAEPRDARQNKEPNKDKKKHEAQKQNQKEKHEAQKEKQNQKEREKQEAAKAKQKEADATQMGLRKEIEDGATQFEHSNSGLDLLRGKISYAKPSKDGESYIAYLHLNWGDLDKQIPTNASVYYSNWDGSVKLQQGGKASVVKEFAFDDRNGTTGGVENHDGLGRKSGKKLAKPGESGFGSGRDTLIRDSDSSMVAWKSGVVGATDGLLIRLELRQAETRGVIQAGNFTVPFETELKP